jgi:PBP1b-binding outer membrane lipoprotein LpoB
MFKEILIALSLLLFVAGCAQQAPEESLPEETPQTGAIDDIDQGISDIGSIEEDLDASDLDDLDTVLEDIENI